jgi:hypothetical protein
MVNKGATGAIVGGANSWERFIKAWRTMAANSASPTFGLL